MKKLLVLLAVLTLSLTLTACGEDVKDVPEDLEMADLDEFLGRDDVQYVDLRNLDERLNAGYIEGFEAIPYFDYLKYQDILVDENGGWAYDAGEIHSQAALENMFNKDKTILLMCGSGARAGFVKEALESIGYENVINILGFASYVTAEGEFLVLGGDSFEINLDVKGDYVPGTYFGSSDGLYTAVVEINNAGGIHSIFFDAVTCTVDSNDDGTKDSACTTKQILGDDYNMVTYGGATQEWYLQANELAAEVLAAQGWDATAVDAIAGVTISTDGFMDALEDALTQATE